MSKHTPLSPAVESVQHFINVWTFMKPTTNDVQGLELGHPSREANLTISDLQALLKQHSDLLEVLKDVMHYGPVPEVKREAEKVIAAAEGR